VEQPTTDLIARRLATALAGAPLHVAFLFGSAVQQRLRPDSDVDIGIVPSHDLSLSEELEFQAVLERAVGRDVDLVRLDRASTLLRWEVARTGILLHEPTRGAAAQFLAAAGIEHADLAPLLADAGRRLRRRLAANAS
jgi:uncharacterized protein